MNIPDLDLRLLVTFDLLLRFRSVSRAAEALGSTQPTVSHALKRLRAALGDRLFVRTAQGIEPTPRAEALAGPLREVLDRIGTQLLAAPPFDPGETRRTLVLQLNDVGELVFLPRLLAMLADEAPGVDLRIVSLPAAQLGDALRSGAVDLAIGRFHVPEEAGLFRQRLFSHAFACVVRADHPQPGRRLARREFERAAHAVVEADDDGNALIDAALDAQGLARRVVLRLPHFLAVPAVVVDNGLVATVPWAVGTALARMAAVRMLAPPVDLPRVDVHQWWHARFNEDPFNRWLRERVVRDFAGLDRTRSART